MSWWRGDDSTLNHEGRNDGVAHGNLTFAPGKVGQAFVLDGSSYVTAPTTMIPAGAANRTIEFWGNLTTFGTSTNSEMFVEYGTMTSGADFAVFTMQNPAVWFSQWGGSVQGGSFGGGALGTWSQRADERRGRGTRSRDDIRRKLPGQRPRLVRGFLRTGHRAVATHGVRETVSGESMIIVETWSVVFVTASLTSS